MANKSDALMQESPVVLLPDTRPEFGRKNIEWRESSPHFVDTEPSKPAPLDCCTHNCEQGDRCPMRRPAEAATSVGADQRGRHVHSWLSRAWLRIRRALT